MSNNIGGRSGPWLFQQNTSQETPGGENSANAASGPQSRSVQQLSSSQPARLPSVRELLGLDSNTSHSQFDQALTQSRRLPSPLQGRKGGSVRLDDYASSRRFSQKRQSPVVQSSTDAATNRNDGENPRRLSAPFAPETASGDVRPEAYRQGPPYADRFDGGNAFVQTSHESPVPGGGVVSSLNSNDENWRYLTSDLSNAVDAPAFPVGGPTETGSAPPSYGNLRGIGDAASTKPHDDRPSASSPGQPSGPQQPGARGGNIVSNIDNRTQGDAYAQPLTSNFITGSSSLREYKFVDGTLEKKQTWPADITWRSGAAGVTTSAGRFQNLRVDSASGFSELEPDVQPASAPGQSSGPQPPGARGNIVSNIDNRTQGKAYAPPVTTNFLSGFEHKIVDKTSKEKLPGSKYRATVFTDYKSYDVAWEPGFSQLEPDVQAEVTKIFNNLKTKTAPKKELHRSRTIVERRAIKYLIDLRRFQLKDIASAAGASESVVSGINKNPSETRLKRKRDEDKV